MVLARPSKFYTLEGCVFTTATYGETFRPITRTRCCQVYNNAKQLCAPPH